MNYKMAIWDFDGTICDTHNAISHCLCSVINRYNPKFSDQAKVKQCVALGIGLEETLTNLCNLGSKENFNLDEAISEYRDIYQKEGKRFEKLFPSIPKIFAELNEKNITLIIVSNKGIKAVENALERFSLVKFVSLAIGAVPDIRKKPDPMVYTEIIAKQFPKVNHTETLVIGDTEADIKFAQNANLNCCWASYGYGNTEKCRSLNPKHTITKVDEILSIFV